MRSPLIYGERVYVEGEDSGGSAVCIWGTFLCTDLIPHLQCEFALFFFFFCLFFLMPESGTNQQDLRWVSSQCCSLWNDEFLSLVLSKHTRIHTPEGLQTPYFLLLTLNFNTHKQHAITHLDISSYCCNNWLESHLNKDSLVQRRKSKKKKNTQPGAGFLGPGLFFCFLKHKD